MIKGLIQRLAFDYQFISVGRDALSEDDLISIKVGDKAIVNKAHEVLKNEIETYPGEMQHALDQAQLIDQHIDEMVQWIINLEII